jgi:hypothetical protein
MTAFGKILVFLNLAFSLIGMTWALGLWTARIDWTLTPAKGAEPPGKLKEVRDEITAELAALKAPEAGWRAAREGLLNQEYVRRADRVWYADELKHLRTGATAKAPARVVKRVRHLPEPDPRNFNRPTMEVAKDRDDKPLLSLSAYNAQSETTLKELSLALGQLQKKIDEDIELTDRLVGTPERKGLQQRLIDERVKREGIVFEQSQVRPLLVNVAAESDSILRRHASLLRRLDELRRYLRKHHKVDGAAGAR